MKSPIDRLHPASFLAMIVCAACSGEIESSGQDAALGDASSDAARADAGDAQVLADAAIKDATIVDASVADARVDAAMDASVVVMGEPPSLTGITAAHNQTRANASPTPSPALGALTWSNTVATAAQITANKCLWMHSNTSYGENLYASTGSPPSGAAVVTSWSSETAHYNYAANTCAENEDCGHYTQIVWRSSTLVGCGAATCTQNSPWDSGTWHIVVCNYSPAGNNGNRPY
jgi:pathogenesis-related protein 1